MPHRDSCADYLSGLNAIGSFLSGAGTIRMTAHSQLSWHLQLVAQGNLERHKDSSADRGGTEDHASRTDCDYVNTDGQCVAGPERAPSGPPGATAQCSDGTYSYSAPAPAPGTAVCRNGFDGDPEGGA